MFVGVARTLYMLYSQQCTCYRVATGYCNSLLVQLVRFTWHNYFLGYGYVIYILKKLYVEIYCVITTALWSKFHEFEFYLIRLLLYTLVDMITMIDYDTIMYTAIILLWYKYTYRPRSAIAYIPLYLLRPQSSSSPTNLQMASNPRIIWSPILKIDT